MKSGITGPLFKLFGSKWSASKYYPTPEYDTIVEPFAGSAGYSLRHYQKSVRIAESNTHVYNLWNWLINDAKEDDIRSIPLNIPEGTDIRELGMTDGQNLLLKNWQRTNNVGNCWTISPWGNKPGQWTENTRSRVAEQSQCIKHWNVYKNSSEVFDNTENTWFVDPPYLYNYNYKTTVDFESLGKTCNSLLGQVIVCEATCPKTQQVPGWLPFKPFRRTVTSRRKANNNHHSNELIWTNR